MRLQDRLFIGGEFVDAARRGDLRDAQPARRLGHRAASPRPGPRTSTGRSRPRAAAFPAWARLQASARGRLLLRLADPIEANADELARIESLDTGHPIRDSRNLDVARTAATFRYFGGMADKIQGDVIPVEPGFLNYVLREPLGVVGDDRAVELPADVLQLEDGSGAGRRQHRGDEAGRAHAASARCGWPS